MGLSRSGQITISDVLVLVAIFAALLMLAPPALVVMREQARHDQCQDNLRRIGTGLEAHHQSQGQYPPAAIQPDARAMWVLKNGQDKMVVAHANWAIELLPYMGEERLAGMFYPQKPISDSANAKVRMAELPWMTCPEDTYHRPDNPYRCIPKVARKSATPGETMASILGPIPWRGTRRCKQTSPGWRNLSL